MSTLKHTPEPIGEWSQEYLDRANKLKQEALEVSTESNLSPKQMWEELIALKDELQTETEKHNALKALYHDRGEVLRTVQDQANHNRGGWVKATQENVELLEQRNELLAALEELTSILPKTLPAFRELIAKAKGQTK